MLPAHEPTLIAAARSHMTASSPRGTFSQAELTGDWVITRCITRSLLSQGYTQAAYSPGGGPTALAAAGLDALSGGVASAILRRLSGLRRR
jgi:hypothetical protein